MLIQSETVQMRRVRGPSTERFMGYDVVTDEGGVWDFDRTTYRLLGVPVWRRDRNFVEVPMHIFVRQCLGLPC